MDSRLRGNDSLVQIAMTAVLFVAKGFYRIHICGPIGRINAEDYADRPADSKGQYKRNARNYRWHLAEMCDQERDQRAQAYPQDAAEEGQHESFREELNYNIALAGAECPADADLARPLADGGQHNIHNPDAADQQRNRSDGTENDAEKTLGLSGLVEQL